MGSQALRFSTAGKKKLIEGGQVSEGCFGKRIPGKGGKKVTRQVLPVSVSQ